MVGGETPRSEEHTSELQSLRHLVCRLLLEKKEIYLTWASLINADYFCKPFVSPLCSPCLATTCTKGAGFDWIPWLTFFFFLMIRRPPRFTFFPSTTLFR